MAFNDSYTTLKAAVQEWAQRANSEAKLIARIPDFIAICETRLNRDLYLDAMLQLQFVNTVVDADWLAIPERFKSMRSIRMVELNPIVSLKYRTPSQMDVTQGANRLGKPAYYSIAGDRIRLGPIPDAVYRVEQFFFQKFELLSDTNSTNWYLENAPEALLFGSLVELAPYLKDAEFMSLWQSRLQSAVQELTGATEAFLWAGELTMQTDFNVFEPPRVGF